MNYIQLTIEAGEKDQELFIAALAELDTTGFEQNATHLIAYFKEDNFRSYEVNQILQGVTFQTETIAEKNWNEEWEKNFEPVVVPGFCSVRAHFHQPIAGVQHEIIITPKMSFGTGHHATTYMMMQCMQELDFTNKSVFDFGTGTGILAILAEKLGAAKVYAIDNDEWSVNNAQENFENNQCKNITIELKDSIPLHKPFDIILANINRNVILEFLPQLKNTAIPGGYILFSGLLTSDEKSIVDACIQNGMKVIKQFEKTNWIALLIVNGI